MESYSKSEHTTSVEKREKEKMRNKISSRRENFLDKQTQALRARERKKATLSPLDVCQSRLS